MRPKTANHRNCNFLLNLDFIEDKEMAIVPGPGNYEGESSKLIGKNLISKFKSAVLAGPMMSKSKRFSSSQSISWLR